MSSEPAILSASAAAASVGGLLEFEKPLVRIHHDIEEMEREQRETGRDLSADIRQQRARLRTTTRRLYNSLTPWETVLVARHPKRPLSTDHLRMVFRDFCELHGDRAFSDDKAIITGFCCNDKNFADKGPAITPGVHINAADAYDSAQKIKEMADILIPLHDPSLGRMKSIP